MVLLLLIERVVASSGASSRSWVQALQLGYEQVEGSDENRGEDAVLVAEVVLRPLPSSHRSVC